MYVSSFNGVSLISVCPSGWWDGFPSLHKTTHHSQGPSLWQPLPVRQWCCQGTCACKLSGIDWRHCFCFFFPPCISVTALSCSCQAVMPCKNLRLLSIWHCLMMLSLVFDLVYQNSVVLFLLTPQWFGSFALCNLCLLVLIWKWSQCGQSVVYTHW